MLDERMEVRLPLAREHRKPLQQRRAVFFEEFNVSRQTNRFSATGRMKRLQTGSSLERCAQSAKRPGRGGQQLRIEQLQRGFLFERDVDDAIAKAMSWRRNRLRKGEPRIGPKRHLKVGRGEGRSREYMENLQGRQEFCLRRDVEKCADRLKRSVEQEKCIFGRTFRPTILQEKAVGFEGGIERQTNESRRNARKRRLKIAVDKDEVRRPAFMQNGLDDFFFGQRLVRRWLWPYRFEFRERQILKRLLLWLRKSKRQKLVVRFFSPRA